MWKDLDWFKTGVVVLGLLFFACARHCEASTYQEYAAQMEQKHSIEAGLLQDICYVESHWKHPTSGGAHGEIGLCQLKTTTALMVCPQCQTRSSVVHQGVVSDTVVAIQTELKRKGYQPGTIDGVFGLKTHTAVTQLQTKSGLLPDGIVGPKTWKVLFGRSMEGTSLAEQLSNPEKNIELAALYIVWLRNELKTNDRDILAAAYNGGQANGTVDYMLKVRNAKISNN